MSKHKYIGIGILFFLVSYITSCKSEETADLPVLETKQVNAITMSSAISGGNIITDGGVEILAKGVCWSTVSDPSISDQHTEDGKGDASYDSFITGLLPETAYTIRSYATNSVGTAYGGPEVFKTLSTSGSSQIIADHTVVDKYDDIPQYYIDSVKKMWVTVLGESHSRGYMTGLTLLESLDPRYSVNVTETGTPEAYTESHLRASNAYWYTGINQWAYLCGEAGFWTNSTGITRIKNSIAYCNTHNLAVSAIGFGWCWDMTAENVSSGIDPTYGCHWYGRSVGGPEGSRAWGLDAADYAETGNSVSLATYLAAVEGYIEYCKTNGYNTKIYFTTGTVDIYAGEAGYQGYLKNERIREYVRADASRILLDYADILCYDNDGTPGTTTWNGHTYPFITSANLNPTVGAIHISEAGSIRLAKAMWWMLARIAGWDGG